MIPKRLSEVQALLTTADFVSWWKDLEQARAESEAAKRFFDQVLSQVAMVDSRAEITQKDAIDTLYRADEYQDWAAKAQVEAAETENKSFRAVSDFEEQRFRASEVWYRLGASEKELEERREAHRQSPNRRSESELKAAERAYQALAQDYASEMERRNKLWEEVEKTWAKSAELNLLVAEQQLLRKRVRREAEALFASAEEKKEDAIGGRREAEQARQQLAAAAEKIRKTLQQAAEQFGCGVGVDFLYFRQNGNQKAAFCISLIADRENYNLELKPLTVYSLDTQRGVAHIEPAREQISRDRQGDQRFEDYFLRGRKGELAPAGG